MFDILFTAHVFVWLSYILWPVVGDYFQWWSKHAAPLCRLVGDCGAGCWVHLPDKIELGKSHPCILIRSRCRSEGAVHRAQRFVTGYYDEWFAEEIRVEFVTPLTIISVSITFN